MPESTLTKKAITKSLKKLTKEKPFDKRYYLDYDFSKIFDDLGVLLIPVVSLNKIEEILNICDGLVVTGIVFITSLIRLSFGALAPPR